MGDWADLYGDVDYEQEFDHEPVDRSWICAYCGQEDLQWLHSEQGNRLVDEDEVVHACDPEALQSRLVGLFEELEPAPRKHPALAVALERETQIRKLVEHEARRAFPIGSMVRYKRGKHSKTGRVTHYRGTQIMVEESCKRSFWIPIVSIKDVLR